MPPNGCRVSESEGKGILEAMHVQLKAQQDVCKFQAETLQERLHNQEEAANAAAAAAAEKHAELLKKLQTAASDGKAQCTTIQEAVQQQIQVCLAKPAGIQASA